MKKLLLLILIILPCVVFAQNKSKKKVIKTKHGTITEWSEDGGLFRQYSKDYVTVIGGDDGDDYGSSEPRTNTQESKSESYLGSRKVSADCKCKGKTLKGRVKVVDYDADFRVKVSGHSADLRVKKVDYLYTSIPCGEWRFVDYDADFTVQFVDYDADFTIKFVDNNPGRE